MDVEAGMGGHGNGAEVELRVEVRWGREWSWSAGGTRVWCTSSGLWQQGLKDPTASFVEESWELTKFLTATQAM